MSTVDHSKNDHIAIPIEYNFSIKDLVAFCHRTGRVLNTDTPKPTAKQGQLVHQKLQQQANKKIPGYQSEVSVNYSYTEDTVTPYTLTLKGRADGVWISENQLHIEEIKSTFYVESQLPEHLELEHLAQAKLYGFLLAKEYPDTQENPINIIVTYWHLASQSRYQLSHAYSFQDLELFFNESLTKLQHWLNLVSPHQHCRNQDLNRLNFPFSEYRQGQKALAGACYKSALNKNQMLIHAATGIGKSVGTLFGTLKAVNDTKLEQIWYLTAKNSGKAAASQAIELLLKQTSHLKILHLYNRETTCFCDIQSLEPGPEETPCQWESNFYANKFSAMEDLFQHNLIDLDCLHQVAKRHQLCPNLLTKEIMPWVDVVVADFNYAFSFTARNNEYIEKRGKYIALLIDESHNLANRCRDLFKAELKYQLLDDCLSTIDHSGNAVKNAIQKLNKAIKALPKEPLEKPGKLFRTIEQLKLALEEWLQQAHLLFTPNELLQLRIQLNQWLRLEQFLPDELGAQKGVAFSLMKHKSGVFLENNNPAPVIQALNKPFNNCIFFSGSLLPIPLFRTQLLDIEKHQEQSEPPSALVIESPFPAANLKVLLGNLDMSFKQREFSIAAAIVHIQAIYHQQPGLYLVCVPSYQYLDQIRQALEASPIGIPTLFQIASQESNTKADFEAKLESLHQGLAFIILGGSYAEGIEWSPGQLKGVVILGTGMPSPSSQQTRLSDYFDHALNEQKGFAYTYMYPAINRIIQTAGRIQRNEKDAGLVLLLDKRFRQSRYQELFPSHWGPELINSPEDAAKMAQSFWLDQDSFILPE